MDQDKAAELFLWILTYPEDCEDKKQQLAHAFDQDPETVLNAVKDVVDRQSNQFNPPSESSRFDALVPEYEDGDTTLAGAVPDSESGEKPWSNCIQQQAFTPYRRRYPASLAELVAIVDDARENKRRVRAIGSGHSFSDITNAQDAILVDPGTSLNNVLPLEPSILHPDADPANMIRVQSGIKVADLNAALDARNLALIDMGAYDGQTISGALSTGTHGSGTHYGPMADAILSIVLVSESGTVYQIEPSPSSNPITDAAKFPGHLSEAPTVPVLLKQDDNWFRTAKIAMGCLGLIYSYTLRVTAAFSLSETRKMSTWETLLINPYPDTDKDTQKIHHNCIAVERERVSKRSPSGARLSFWGRILEKGAVEMSRLLVIYLNGFPEGSPGAINQALKFLPDYDPPYVDVSHKVFTLGVENTVPAWALELHFEFEIGTEEGNGKFKGVVDKVLDVFQGLSKQRGWYIAGPIGVRFVKGSDAFLAPEQAGPGLVTCTVECDMLKGIHHDRELLGAIKEEICKGVGEVKTVRVHWGLDWGFTRPEDVRRWYPDFGNWQAVYKEVNAGGMFDNAFTERLKLREDISL
ncbi:FAD-binding domain containing protein [Naviculisporaceae sp. PSN 640]